MVVPTLTLDWLDDDGTDVDLILVDVRPDFLLRFLLAVDDVASRFDSGKEKIDRRTRNARPIETWP